MLPAMASKRLPIKIKKTPGGYRLDFGTSGASLYIYPTADEQRVDQTAPTFPEAEEFVRDVARTLTDAWRPPTRD